MEILFIAPHPDDELLGCDGILLRRKTEGATLGWVIMTKILEDTGWDKIAFKKEKMKLNKSGKDWEFNRNT